MPDPHVVVGSYTRTYYTVATLPAAASMQGEILYVSDANANPATASGSTVAGSGSTRARVKSDGSAWKLEGWA